MTDPVVPGSDANDFGTELDPALIAEIDALGARISAEVVDEDTGEHDETTGTCVHYWSMLVIDEDTGELVCSNCDTSWEPESGPEALGVVWVSASDAFNELHDRVEALEAVVKTRLGVRSCARCGKYFDVDDLQAGTELAGEWACAEHVAVVCGVRRRTHPAAVSDAALWAEVAGLVGTTDLTKVRLYEQLVAAAPEVAAATGCDDVTALANPVVLRAEMAEVLGCAPRLSLRKLAAAVAALLDAPPPAGRAGAGWLGSLVATAQAALAATDTEHAALPQHVAAAAYLDALPATFEARRRVAADLAEGVDRTDLGDDLIAMTGQRAIDLLLDRFTAKPDTGSITDEHDADEHDADEHDADEHDADEHDADEHDADEHDADEHDADEHDADE